MADTIYVERMLATVDPAQRAVVVLHYYLDLSLPETAAALGIPVGTAKSRLNRALGAMRDQGRRRRAAASARPPRSDTHEPFWTRTSRLLGRRLNAALGEVGGPARPDYLADIVAQAGRTRQRPAWTFLERWLPMDIAVRRQGVPRAALVFAVLALLITLLVATVAFIGGRPSQPPLAAATNGLLAFVSGGDIVAVEPDGSGRRTLSALRGR